MRFFLKWMALGLLGPALMTPTAVSAKQTTINVWAWSTADKALRVIAPGFMKRYPDIKVNVVTMPFGDVHQKLLTTMAAGTGSPDVTMVEISHIAAFRGQPGLLVDLNKAPYMASKLKDDFVSYKWAHATDKGHLMAMPWDIGPVGLFYRRDLFDKAGLPSDPALVNARLTDWDSFLVWCRKLTTDANGDGKPEMFGTANAEEVFTNALQQNECSFIDDNYNALIAGASQEGYIKSLKTAQAFRKAGVDAKTWVWETGAPRAATHVTGAWGSGWILKQQPKTSGKWGVAKAPEKPGINWGGSFLAIPGGSKNKDAAWKFIKYACATVEPQNAMYRSEGIFPAYKPAWKDPYYDEPIPFFGDERAARQFTEVAEMTPFIKVFPEDEKLKPFLDTEVSNCLNKGKDPVQAIVDAGRSIQRYISVMPKRRR